MFSDKNFIGPDIGFKNSQSVSPIPIDPLAQIYFDQAQIDNVNVIEPLRTKLNLWYTAMRFYGQLAKMDFYTVPAMINAGLYSTGDYKKLCLIDLIDPTVRNTLSNDYAASIIEEIGWAGSSNAIAFGVENAFNASLAANWSRDSAQYIVLTLGTLADTGYSISATDGVNNINMLLNPEHDNSWMLTNLGLPSIGSYTFRVLKGNSLQWLRSRRSAANLTEGFVNDFIVDSSAAPSVPVANIRTGQFGLFANNAWVPGNYSTNPQGAFGGGSADFDGKLVKELTNTYLLSDLNSAAYMNKNLIQVGDSIFSSMTDGNYGRMVNKTIADLNNHWTVSNLAYQGKFAYDIASEFAVRMAPYFSAYYSKQPLYIAAGRNDVRLTGQTGAQVYTSIKSICTQARAAGVTKIIVSGLLPIEWPGNQPFADAAVLDYHTLMLADCSVPHGTIANYYLPGPGVTWIDGFANPIADPNFSNWAGAAYRVDHTHMTNFGSDTYSTDVQQPILLTL